MVRKLVLLLVIAAAVLLSHCLPANPASLTVDLRPDDALSKGWHELTATATITDPGILQQVDQSRLRFVFFFVPSVNYKAQNTMHVGSPSTTSDLRMPPHLYSTLPEAIRRLNATPIAAVPHPVYLQWQAELELSSSTYVLSDQGGCDAITGVYVVAAAFDDSNQMVGRSNWAHYASGPWCTADGNAAEQGTPQVGLASPSETPDTAEVPDVIGLTLSEATHVLNQAGFDNVGASEGYSDSQPAGLIYNQQPKAGSLVKRRVAVELQVSLGTRQSNPSSTPLPTIKMPNLIGTAFDDAEAKLKELGIPFVYKVEHYDQPPGLVFHQIPDAGSPISPANLAELDVSSGPGQQATPEAALPTQVSPTNDSRTVAPVAPITTVQQPTKTPAPATFHMPVLVGKSQEEATAEVKADGFQGYTFDYEENAQVAAGIVEDQEPPAGNPVDPSNTVVIIHVSKGPGPSATPQPPPPTPRPKVRVVPEGFNLTRDFHDHEFHDGKLTSECVGTTSLSEKRMVNPTAMEILVHNTNSDCNFPPDPDRTYQINVFTGTLLPGFSLLHPNSTNIWSEWDKNPSTRQLLGRDVTVRSQWWEYDSPTEDLDGWHCSMESWHSLSTDFILESDVDCKATDKRDGTTWNYLTSATLVSTNLDISK